MWTQFHDNHSGGVLRTPYKDIWIEAPREEAIEIFIAKFGVDPKGIYCPCCGPNYSIYWGVDHDICDDIEEATSHKRVSRDTGNIQSMEEFKNNKEYLILYKGNNVRSLTDWGEEKPEEEPKKKFVSKWMEFD